MLKCLVRVKVSRKLVENPPNSAWIGPAKVETIPRCKWCCKYIDVSIMSKSAWKSHMKGKEHTDLAPIDNP